VKRGRCPDCKAEQDRRAQARRGPGTLPTDVRADRNWRMTRARYLRTHEQCEQDGCDARATDVHHIVDRADGGSSRFENLEALCHPHHSRITAQRQVRLVRSS
jgi:hypothetical protein